MALRQEVQRPQLARETGKQTTPGTDHNPLGPDFTSLMHKVVQQTAAYPERSLQTAKSRRDYETAFGLLDQASRALDTLLNRCQQLEVHVADVTERSRADAAAAEEVTSQWQKLATAMRSQVEEYEKRLGALKQRAELAEARAAAVQERADAAEQVASEKEDLSTRFHDKVVAAFGIGSRAHGVLEAIAKGTIAEVSAGPALA